jgi:co-chaperonin GroES (HSP10)
MIKPYGSMILIKEEEATDKKTASGLVISAAFTDTSLKKGEIVDIGEGEYNYKGDLIPVNGLDIGDIVYYPRHGGDEIEDEDGSKYLIINSKNVLAVKGN